MKLTRWTPIVMGDGDYADCVIDQDGEYYRVAKVDALLARIRAAVDAEREAGREEREQYAMWHIQVTRHGMKDPRSSPEDVNRAEQDSRDARKALDALLTDGDE